jgi:serine/threonine protein kinase
VCLPDRFFTEEANPPIENANRSYNLIRRVGEGGMAEIFLARVDFPMEVSRLVAFKRILPAYASDVALHKMFFDEARLAMQLNHSSIVSVYDFGMAERRPYLAMEFIDGHDVRYLIDTAIRSARPIPPDCVLHIVSQLAHALAYAHSFIDVHGRRVEVVHRDVSPSNVLVAHNGSVKLTDFGIACVARDMTCSGAIKGKVRYMSPEQARGEPVDSRSDIFSLGTVLAEMLTLKQMFQCGSEVDKLKLVRRGTPPELNLLKQRLSKDILYLVTKAMRPDREQRFQSGDEMADALDEVLRRRSPRFRPANLRAYLETVFPGEKSPRLESVPPRSSDHDNTRPRTPRPMRQRKGPWPIVEVVRKTEQLDKHADAMPLGASAKHPHVGELIDKAKPHPRKRPVLLWSSVAALFSFAAWQEIPHRDAESYLTGVSQSRAAESPAPVLATALARRALRQIVFVSSPAGAHVAVDGEPRCITPCRLALPSTEQVLVEVSSGGYVSWSQELRPESLGSNVVDVALQAEPPIAAAR